MKINEEGYLLKRSESWRELERLLAKSGDSLRGLSSEEFVQFVRLYRQASADLGRLTSEVSNPDVLNYLNAVVGEAYARLYRRPKRKLSRVIVDALYAGANTVRRRQKAIYVSAFFFFFGAFIGAMVLNNVPGSREVLIAPEMEENFRSWTHGDMEERTASQSGFMTFFYAQNNPRVGILTAAFSLPTAGLMGAALMFQNGMLVGTLGSEMQAVGRLGYLIAQITPHGVSEIGGFFVACASGFAVAAALISPGRRRRADALKEAGKDGFVLLVLGLIMIFAAAPIEGWFSFNPTIPLWVKSVFAVLAFTAWMAYFIGYGRKRESFEAEMSAA